MSYSKATVIANPLAGKTSSSRGVERILRELRGFAKAITLVRSQRKGHAIRLAQEAVRNGSDLLVSVGGDGTVNEVANGLIEGKRITGRDCVLGIIPAGASCALARELGIPRGPDSARVIVEGTVAEIDVAEMKWVTPRGGKQRRVMLTVSNFGFGGIVAESPGLRIKRLVGGLAYGLAASLELFRYRSIPLHVEVGGQEIARTRGFCAIVANTRREGGGMLVAPQASLYDGMLDVVVVQDLPLPSRLRHFPKVYMGKHINLPTVSFARGRSVVVSSSEVLPFEFDGESAECRECSIEVVSRGMKVAVPGKATCSPS